MNLAIRNSDLQDLYEKVVEGERLSDEDALRLLQSRDLNALGAMADFARRRKVGDKASYIVNRYLNYSNYCILSCRFCSFARKKRDADGFQLSVEEMVEKAKEALKIGITELHIVGGLHPSLKFDYYLDMLRSLKALDPRLQLKCFTAVEILHLAWLAKRSTLDTLTGLKEAGLDSLTGGGAEIFRKEVRSQIARGKESAEEYCEVHRQWHQLGRRSTCTMLFGHVESLEDRIDHLRWLRDLQDETGGFTGFIPLPFQPENNQIPVDEPPSGYDALRTIAVSRLYLDNFNHITAYWVGLGMNLAQVALNHGADDIHGTIVEEHIFHMAGAQSPQLQTETDMVKAIRDIGQIPVQRDTFYEPIKEWAADESVAEFRSTESSPDRAAATSAATA